MTVGEGDFRERRTWTGQVLLEPTLRDEVTRTRLTCQLTMLS